MYLHVCPNYVTKLFA